MEKFERLNEKKFTPLAEGELGKVFGGQTNSGKTNSSSLSQNSNGSWTDTITGTDTLHDDGSLTDD